MSIINDLSIISLDTIKAFDMNGNPKFILDELQNATIANTQETEDITGRNGRLLNRLKRNKAVTISGSNGLISGGLLEVQTGGTYETKESTPVSWTDYLTVSNNTATTSYVAVGTAGAEIDGIWVRNSEGLAVATLVQDSAVSAGKFVYDPETKKLTFNADELADGTEIIVSYTRNIAGSVVANSTETFSEKAQLYVDATLEDKCGTQYHGQFYLPKVDFSGNFDIAMGDTQAVHDFEAQSLATNSGCYGAGSSSSGDLWTYTVFGVNAPDAN